MGIDADPSLRGDYYLQTNSIPIYDRGVDGMHFEQLDE